MARPDAPTLPRGTFLATTSRTTASPARAQSHPPRMVKSARIRMASDTGAISAAREKDEEVSLKRVAAELRAYEGDERIDALAPVDAIAGEEDERAAGECQHARSLCAMAAMMSAMRSGCVSSGSSMAIASTMSLIVCDGRT